MKAFDREEKRILSAFEVGKLKSIATFEAALRRDRFKESDTFSNLSAPTNDVIRRTSLGHGYGWFVIGRAVGLHSSSIRHIVNFRNMVPRA